MKAEGRRQKAEGRKQTAEGRKQKAEGRKQTAEGRKQKAESRKQKAEGRKQKAESRKQKAEGRKRARVHVLRSAFCLLPSAFCLLLFTACQTTTPPPPPLTFHPGPFDNAFWSILIEEDDGRVVYALNADKLTIPASNRKLFAAAAIASCLGADTKLATEIWRDGDDLVIRGDGDPSLGSWRWERQEDFDWLAQDLRARGITSVRDVIADVSLFDRVTFPGGWKHGNLGSDYAAPVDALAWGENEIPVDRAVPDAALHTANALREALLLRGVNVTGSARVNTEPRAWQERLTDLPSPFVGELLRTVLKNSHNLYTEMLLKRLGGAAGFSPPNDRLAGGLKPAAPQATYEEALAVERAFLLSEVGLDDGSFRFVDGSGLAPDDLLTPRAAIQLLRWMNHPSRRAFWWSVLAQPNNEGTLRRRLVTLEERMRGKTGTINGVNALSGVIAMPEGGYRYFSAIVNHHIGDGDEAVQLIDRLVEAAASRTAGRTASAPPPPASR